MKMLGFLLMSIPLVSYATTWYVDDDNFGKAGCTGASEQQAYGTIQAAIAAETTKDGDEIVVLPGTYDRGETLGLSSSNRVYVTKALTIRSRDGAAVTQIVGATDSQGSYGMGDAAVRCVACAGSVAVRIEGFTLRNGASRNGGDAAENRGGGVNFNSTENGELVDCVVTGCVGTRGGGVWGGRLARCLVTDCRATENGAGLRNASAYNCVFTHCANGAGNGSSGIGVLAYPRQVVNCTVADNYLPAFMSEGANGYGPVCNTLVVANTYNGSPSGNYTNCTLQAMASGGEGNRQASDEEVMGLLTRDWRLLSHARAAGTGSIACLELIPAAFRDKDFYGKPRKTGDSVSCGAVEAVVTPATGKIRLSIVNSTYGSNLVVGVRVCQNGLYAYADSPYANLRIDCGMCIGRGLKGLVRYDVTSTLGGSAVEYPALDDSVTMFYPAVGVTNALVPVLGDLRFVDAAKPTGGDGLEPATAYHSIQEAVNARVSGTSYVVRVAPGDYSDVETLALGVSNRVYAPAVNNSSIRIRSVSGAGQTIIRGAADGTQANGCGAAAVRCVCGGDGLILQGFTLTDGHTGATPGDSDGDAVHGGGACFNGAAFVSDCILTNCVGSRAAAAWSGTFHRCTFVDNAVSTSGGNGIVRAGTYVACLFYGNMARTQAVLGYTTIGYQCTVADNVGEGKYDNYSVLNSAACHASILGGMSGGVDIRSTGAYNSLYKTYSGTPDDPESLQADAIFADAARRDYRVNAFSPACGFAKFAHLKSPVDRYGKPYAIGLDGTCVAGAIAAPVRGVRTSSSCRDGVEPTGLSTVREGTLAVVASRADEREFLGFSVNGTLVAGSPTLNVGAYDPSDPADAAGWDVVAVYGTNWYVNANPGVGSDSNKGWSRAEPVRSLAVALAKAESGDVVTVADGVYDFNSSVPPKTAVDGLGTVTSTLATRAVVPENCILQSENGAASTAIVGAPASVPDAYGCGADACRCVFLGANAVLRGFTVRGGRGGADGSESVDNSGGGILAATGNARVEDCVITNCAASRGGGVRNGLLMRCRLLDDKATSNGAAARGAELRNCLIDYCGGSADQAVYSLSLKRPVVNCTFGVHNAVGKNHYSLAGQSAANCVFLGGISQVACYTNCAFGNGADVVASAIVENLNPVTRVDLGLDDEGRPLSVGSAVVDAGLRSVLDVGRDVTDLTGSQRVYDSRVDIGCYEFDYRPVYAAALGSRRRVSVVSVTPEAEVVSEGVLVKDGSLQVNLLSPVNPGRYSFVCQVKGTGVLTVALPDGSKVDLRAEDGRHPFEFASSSQPCPVGFEYAAEEDDLTGAVVGNFKCACGMALIVR